MIEHIEKWLLIEALREHGNNKSATAKTLGITREGLHKKLSKAKFRQASAVCPGIAALVKDGKTQRSSALTQIKASLVGVSIPGECN
jgi:predicted DNA-binding protein (UPF0251 family)